MTVFDFPATNAIDPMDPTATVASAVFVVIPEGTTDTSSPVPIRDLTDVPITTLTSSARGVIPEFRTTDVPSVVLVCVTAGQTYRSGVISHRGLLTAAQDAATSAEALARKSFRLGRPGATVPTWWGAFTAATAPTAAEGAQAGDLGILLP